MAADKRCLKYVVALKLPDCRMILFPRESLADNMLGNFNATTDCGVACLSDTDAQSYTNVLWVLFFPL